MKNDELKTNQKIVDNVTDIVDRIFHAYASYYREDAENMCHGIIDSYNWNTRTEPKEQDVCPECGFGGYINEDVLGKGYRVCAQCNQEWWTDINYGTGKSTVDKIREEWKKEAIERQRVMIETVHSQQEEIERLRKVADKGREIMQASDKVIKKLEAENEAMRCCGNCKINRGDCYQVLDCGVPDKYKLWQPKENN